MRYPSILKICSDEHSPFVAGFAGDSIVRTPHLDRLAAQGTRFDRCYAANPGCVPGRYAMISGQLPREGGTLRYGDILPLETPTYMRHFAQHGYQTTCVGKQHFHGPEQMYGWMFRPYGDMECDPAAIPGYDRARDVASETGKAKFDFKPFGGVMPYLLKTAGPGTGGFQLFDQSVTREACLHLRDYFETLIHTRYQGERPLLFEVSFKTPHWPFVCPQELFDYYRERVELPERGLPDGAPEPVQRKAASDNADVTDEQKLNARAAYYGLVEWMDTQIGIVLQTLADIGRRDEFIIMYGSDHGEMAGERGLWGKHCFYEASVRTPFILAGPGIPAGRTVHANTSLMDVFPTLTDLAGLPTPEGIRGQSMLPLLEHDDDHGRIIYSELHDQGSSEMALSGDLKLISYDNGQTELYDLQADPHETCNLSGRAAYGPAQKKLQQALGNLPAIDRN